MAKSKRTPVQAFRLQQAEETIKAVAAEINGGGKAKGDAYFAVIHLSGAARNVGEAMAIAIPPLENPTPDLQS